MNERNLKILGWVGTMLSVIMYVSYVPQILGNLHGNKTFFLQPLAAAINCTIWTSYGLLFYLYSSINSYFSSVILRVSNTPLYSVSLSIRFVNLSLNAFADIFLTVSFSIR